MRSMQRKKAAVEIACGQHVNSAASPEDLHKLLVQALNSGDLDALVALYALDGFLMARSGPARGLGAIRRALAEYVAMKPTLQLTTRRVVQAGGHGAACGRLAISRNRRRWQRCGNLWNEYRSGSSSAGWELALPHRSPLRTRLNGLDQVLGSSAFDHALTTACCESMRRN